MNLPTVYVVDASIALKWMFDDEPHFAEAQKVLADYRSGAIDLVAPDHIVHEVLNGLRSGVLKGRISRETAELHMYDFLGLGLRLASGTARCIAGLHAALALNCAYYDGLYVSLASEQQLQLVYADRRLKNTLAGRFELGLWIEDYVSPNASQVPSDN